MINWQRQEVGRWQRREKKLAKEKSRMKQHGKDIGVIYRDRILKKNRSIKDER